MGIDYYLTRPDTKTVFALGRWTPVIDAIRAHAMSDEATLREALRDAVRGHEASLSVEPQTYADEVARRVAGFVGGQLVEVVTDIQLCDDYGDPFRDENDDLRQVDSVFTHDWRNA